MVLTAVTPSASNWGYSDPSSSQTVLTRWAGGTSVWKLLGSIEEVSYLREGCMGDYWHVVISPLDPQIWGQS